MNKIKVFLVSVMMSLCVSALVIGVYSLSTSSHTISGTITITAPKADIEVQVFEDYVSESNKITEPIALKANGKVDFGEIQIVPSLMQDVTSMTKDIIIRVKNKSVVELGVYFSNGDKSASQYDTMGSVYESGIQKTPLNLVDAKGTESTSDDVTFAQVYLQFYSHAMPMGSVNSNGELIDYVDMVATIKPTQTYEISNFALNLDLCIEQYYANNTTGDASDVTGNFVKIASTVKEINNNAFANNTSITGVCVPASVECIGNNAFDGCTALSGVGISTSELWQGEAITAITWNESNLNQTNLSNTLVTDGNFCLVHSAKQPEGKAAPVSYFTIADGAITAYVGPTNITEIIFPETYSLDEGGNVVEGTDYEIVSMSGVFTTNDEFAAAMRKIKINIPEISGNMMLASFSYLSGITDFWIGENVAKLPTYGFTNSKIENLHISSLKDWCEIDFSAGVGILGAYCCKLLQSVENLCLNGEVITEINFAEHGVTSIPAGAFSYSKIKFADLSSVTSIGALAFYNCWYLNRVVIGSGITEVPSYCFTGAVRLVEIYNKSSLASSAFGCSNLKNCYTTEGGEGQFVEDNGCVSYVYNSVGYVLGPTYGTKVFRIPETVAGATSLQLIETFTSSEVEEVYYASWVTSVGAKAFYQLSTLKAVHLSDSITKIGDSAFYSCTNLVDIYWSNKLTSVGHYAFEACNALQNVYITDLAAWFNNNSNSTFVQFGTSTAGSTASRDCHPFYWASNLYLNGELVTDLVIPESVTKVDVVDLYGIKCIKSLKVHSKVTSFEKSYRECEPIHGTDVTVIFDANVGSDIFSMQRANTIACIYVLKSVVDNDGWALSKMPSGYTYPQTEGTGEYADYYCYTRTKTE